MIQTFLFVRLGWKGTLCWRGRK